MYPSVLGQVYHALVLYRNHRGNLFAHNDFLLIHLEIRDDSVGQSLIDDLQPSLGSRKSIGRSGDDHRLAVVGDAVGIGLCLDFHIVDTVWDDGITLKHHTRIIACEGQRQAPALACITLDRYPGAFFGTFLNTCRRASKRE